MSGLPHPDLKAVLDAIKPEGWAPKREQREWCAVSATASAAAYLSAVRAHKGEHEMDTLTTTTGVPNLITQGAFQTSPALDLLATDLAAAQAEMLGAVKGSTNTFFHSEYADFASVWRACRGPLTSHGLSVVQMPVSSEGAVGVVTLLLHKSGQWIKSSVFATPKDTGAQASGSVITYLRRYALAGVGIPQVDDDGEAGEGGHIKAAPAHVTPTPTPTPTRRAPMKPAAPVSPPFQAGTAPWDETEAEPGSYDGPDSDGSGVRVTSFRRATSKPGSATTWSAGFVTLENGLDGGSFDEAVIVTLEAAFQKGVPVLYTAEPSKRDPKKMNITAASFASSVAM